MQRGQTSCRDTGRRWLSASQGEAWNRAFSDRPQKGQPCQHLDFVLLVFRKWSNRFLLFEPLSLWVVLCYGNPTKVGWRKQWHPTPVLLPGKSYGWRSLVGCSPRGHWGSDMTERLHFHFSLSCIGEGNGTPLQCSCLENPRDRGAWWAAVSGVAQSQTRLKRLSSSSSSKVGHLLCGF